MPKVALHEFTTRVNDDTGEEKTFLRGDTYDGPPERLKVLEDPKAFPDQGAFVADSTSDEGKAAVVDGKQRAKAAQTESVQPAAQAETKGA